MNNQNQQNLKRQTTVSKKRRLLAQAMWTAPTVMVIALPAHAQTSGQITLREVPINSIPVPTGVGVYQGNNGQTFFDGNALVVPATDGSAGTTASDQDYSRFVAVFDASAVTFSDASQSVTITVSARLENLGPDAQHQLGTNFSIADSSVSQTFSAVSSAPVGYIATPSLTLNTIAGKLTAGEVFVFMQVETFHSHAGNPSASGSSWRISNFTFSIT